MKMKTFLQVVLVASAASTFFIGWLAVALSGLMVVLLALDSSHEFNAARNLSAADVKRVHASLDALATSLYADLNKRLEEHISEIKTVKKSIEEHNDRLVQLHNRTQR